jgi:hypothetical protein
MISMCNCVPHAHQRAYNVCAGKIGNSFLFTKIESMSTGYIKI